jgi:hypothetical protein
LSIGLIGFLVEMLDLAGGSLPAFRSICSTFRMIVSLESNESISDSDESIKGVKKGLARKCYVDESQILTTHYTLELTFIVTL